MLSIEILERLNNSTLESDNDSDGSVKQTVLEPHKRPAIGGSMRTEESHATGLSVIIPRGIDMPVDHRNENERFVRDFSRRDYAAEYKHSCDWKKGGVRSLWLYYLITRKWYACIKGDSTGISDTLSELECSRNMRNATKFGAARIGGGDWLKVT